MKAVWKGSIGFGMVNIPIALYSAVGDSGVDFHLLHQEDQGRIEYQRKCKKCGEIVDWENIKKGMQIGKDEYYSFTKEEISNLRPEDNDLIEIAEFIDSSEIKWIYLDKHYYLGPQTEKEKPYFLLKRILKEKQKVAIGTFVMRENEYVVAVRDYQQGLLLSILNYYEYIRNFEQVPKIAQSPKISEEELDLAYKLLDHLYNDDYHHEKYQDTFEQKLKERIKKKMEGEKISGNTRITEQKGNLIQALRASVEKA